MVKIFDELVGDHVRVVPMEGQHILGLYKAGNDKTIWSHLPKAINSLIDMESFVDDGINNYELKQIETPPGLFKDGAPYSICVTFTPQSQGSGFSTAESCQQFTNKKGSLPEEPFINLDEGVQFTNNQ